MSVTGKERVQIKPGLPTSPRSPRRGSVMIQEMESYKEKKRQEAMQAMASNTKEMLHSHNGKAQAMFSNTEDSLRRFEHEVRRLEGNKKKRQEDQAKMAAELKEIENMIGNLQPRYKECCEALSVKLRMKKMVQDAMKNTRSKTGMLLDFQRVEVRLGMQAERDLLRRQELISLGKDPGEPRVAGSEGDMRVPAFRASSQLNTRKKGLPALGLDQAKLVAAATAAGSL